MQIRYAQQHLKRCLVRKPGTETRQHMAGFFVFHQAKKRTLKIWQDRTKGYFALAQKVYYKK